MTASQFLIAFNTRFYASTSVDALGWSNSEISEFLNYAQDALVTELVKNNNLELLSTLVRTAEITSSGGVFENKGNGEFFLNNVLKNDYENFWYFLEGVITTSTSGIEIPYRLEKISPTEIPFFKSFSDNKTLFRNQKICIMESRNPDEERSTENYFPHFIFLLDSFKAPSGTTISKFNFKYLTKPTRFNLTTTVTDIPDVLHNDIVELAVRKAVESYISTNKSNQ